jgi:transcriptional regulator with XRE-family HTH domain
MEEYKMDIKNLQQLRTEKGWTRKNLADKLAVSVKTVQAWEQGFRVPRPSTLSMLDKLFKEDNNVTQTVFNNFFGIGLSMKPNIKIVRLYASEEKLNNFVNLLAYLKDGSKLNGYSLFKLHTIDISPKDLLANNETIQFSQIKDLEITKVYQKGLSIKDIKNCQLRANVLEG